MGRPGLSGKPPLFCESHTRKGAHPVLVTPLGRNIWNSDGTYPDLLEEHARAVQKVARETGTPCIDLHGWSVRWIKEMGMSLARDYFHPGDYTHTNDYGACLFGAFMADSLIRLFPKKLGQAGEKKNIDCFVPPKGLWEELQPVSEEIKVPSSGTQDQFDAMERSSAGLLAVIAKAKEGSRQMA